MGSGNQIPDWKVTDLARALEPFLLQQFATVPATGGGLTNAFYQIEFAIDENGVYRAHTGASANEGSWGYQLPDTNLYWEAGATGIAPKDNPTGSVVFVTGANSGGNLYASLKIGYRTPSTFPGTLTFISPAFSTFTVGSTGAATHFLGWSAAYNGISAGDYVRFYFEIDRAAAQDTLAAPIYLMGFYLA